MVRLAAIRRVNSQVSGKLTAGIATQGLSSLTNFLVPLIALRLGDSQAFGAAALCISAYALGIAASRAVNTDAIPVLYQSDSPLIYGAARQAIAGSIAVGLIAGIVVEAFSIIFIDDPTAARLLLIAAVAFPILLAQDAMRFIAIAVDRPSVAVTIDLVWLLTQMLSLATFLYILDLPNMLNYVALLSWIIGALVSAATGILIGIAWNQSRTRVNTEQVRYYRDSRPYWPRYLVEAVLMTGGPQILVFLITVIKDLQYSAEFRAPQVALSPVLVIMTGALPILLVHLGRLRTKSLSVYFRSLRTMNACMISVSVLLASALVTSITLFPSTGAALSPNILLSAGVVPASICVIASFAQITSLVRIRLSRHLTAGILVRAIQMFFVLLLPTLLSIYLDPVAALWGLACAMTIGSAATYLAARKVDIP